MIARVRVVAAVAVGALVLALVGVALVGFAYSNVVRPPDDSVGSLVGMNDNPNTGPKPTVAPPSDAELAVMSTLDGYVDQCMADAGFPEYFEQNVYSEDYVEAEPWDAHLSTERATEAFIALWGDTGAGADYRWDEAGCRGYGTHMIGADSAN